MKGARPSMAARINGRLLGARKDTWDFACPLILLILAALIVLGSLVAFGP